MQDILTDLNYTPAFASRTKRWVACLIDYIISFTISGIASYVFGKQAIDDDGGSVWQLTGIPAFFAIILPWLILFPVIESYNDGQTLGKALFRIRTVKDDNSNLSFGSSLVKHLFDLVDYLPFFGIVGLIVASNNNKKQRVGDLVANTIVIEARK